MKTIEISDEMYEWIAEQADLADISIDQIIRLVKSKFDKEARRKFFTDIIAGKKEVMDGIFDKETDDGIYMDDNQ